MNNEYLEKEETSNGISIVKNDKWLDGSSKQIAETIVKLTIPEGGNNQFFVDNGKFFLNSILSTITYFRDVKKEVVTFQDIKNLFNPYCVLAILKPTMQDAVNDENTRSYAKYWIPEDYKEEGMRIGAKEMVRNYAQELGAEKDGTIQSEKLNTFKDIHSFSVMQFWPTLNTLNQKGII